MTIQHLKYISGSRYTQAFRKSGTKMFRYPAYAEYDDPEAGRRIGHQNF